MFSREDFGHHFETDLTLKCSCNICRTDSYIVSYCIDSQATILMRLPIFSMRLITILFYFLSLKLLVLFLTNFVILNFFTAPNVYDVPKADKILLDKSPKYSFGAKPEIEIKSDTPG